MAKDVHNLGTFHTLAEVWQQFPLGGNCDDYVFIDGLRYDWNVYERQWLTSVIYHEQEWIFDIAEYDWLESDWRKMADGIYSVCNEGTPIGRLLISGGSFTIDGYLYIEEGADGETFDSVEDGDGKQDYSRVCTSADYHNYEYSKTDDKYVLSIVFTEEDRNTITDIEDKVADLTPRAYSFPLLSGLTKSSGYSDIVAAFTPIGGDEMQIPRPGDLVQGYYLIQQIQPMLGDYNAKITSVTTDSVTYGSNTIITYTITWINEETAWVLVTNGLESVKSLTCYSLASMAAEAVTAITLNTIEI